MTETAVKHGFEPLPVRRNVNRKILVFSVLAGIPGALLTIFGYIASAYPVVTRWKDINQQTLGEIRCLGGACDTKTFTTDFQLDSPDYLIDLQTRYLINVPTASAADPGRFSPLDYSDTEFIARFRQPESYATPDGEIWRLYSRQTEAVGRKLEIIVGYTQKAPTKMLEVLPSQLGLIDNRLRSEAEKIAQSLGSADITLHARRSGFSADGFQIVDANSQEVLEWGPWLPTFLPKHVRVPNLGLRPFIYDGDLYLLQTDGNDRILAAALIQVGSVGSLGLFGITGLLATSLVVFILSRRFMRDYFAISGVRVPNLREAQSNGEGQNVEFKRGLSSDESSPGSVEDELLKTIAAFANTNDGVIFLGVDDRAQLKGLRLDFSQRDRLERKIRQLVRNRIKPTPPFQIRFDDAEGALIARIVVGRGEAPAYLLGGVIYVRYGSSDVQAQPEDLTRLISQYAF